MLFDAAVSRAAALLLAAAVLLDAAALIASQQILLRFWETADYAEFTTVASEFLC